MKKPANEDGQGTGSATESIADANAEAWLNSPIGSPAVVVVYPFTLCPICEAQEGTMPGFCHLTPTPADPSSVLVAFYACPDCNSRSRIIRGKERYAEAKRIATFFDRWLELEYGQRRGQA